MVADVANAFGAFERVAEAVRSFGAVVVVAIDDDVVSFEVMQLQLEELVAAAAAAVLA